MYERVRSDDLNLKVRGDWRKVYVRVESSKRNSVERENSDCSPCAMVRLK